LADFLVVNQLNDLTFRSADASLPVGAVIADVSLPCLEGDDCLPAFGEPPSERAARHTLGSTHS